MSTRISLGNITLHRIVEQENCGDFEALKFFKPFSEAQLAENRAWLSPKYIDENDRLRLCIQSYLVQTPHHNILVDTCVGNHKPRPTRPFWNMMKSDQYEKSLAAAGFALGDIDFVMCTHLHTDHVGWNTRLENGRWVPTFPKARYVFADRELEFWTKREQGDPVAVPLDHRFGAPDRRRQPRRRRQERARLQRPRHADPDARPQHRPLLGARRQARCRRRRHRRHDPFARCRRATPRSA